MAIGKTLRFQIFARDGFICQYCGRRPPDVVLEVDHVHPYSEGGTDEELNLVTACFDCNRGKSAKVIARIAPRPDADLLFLKTQQELAEAERYLSTKRARDEAYESIRMILEDLWRELLCGYEPNACDLALLDFEVRAG